MATAIDILRGVQHVVVWDYPSEEIPDALTRAGLRVTIYSGPDKTDVVASELIDGDVVCRPVGQRPAAADLLFVYRPLPEIDGILADARRIGVQTTCVNPTPKATTTMRPRGAPGSKRQASPTSTHPTSSK